MGRENKLFFSFQISNGSSINIKKFDLIFFLIFTHLWVVWYTYTVQCIHSVCFIHFERYTKKIMKNFSNKSRTRKLKIHNFWIFHVLKAFSRCYGKIPNCFIVCMWGRNSLPKLCEQCFIENEMKNKTQHFSEQEPKHSAFLSSCNVVVWRIYDEINLRAWERNYKNISIFKSITARRRIFVGQNRRESRDKS